MELVLGPVFIAGMFAGFLMATIVGVTLWNRLREGN